MRYPVSALLAALIAAPLWAAETSRFTGQAVSPNGETLYSEHHEVTGSCREGYWQPDDHKVVYRKPEQSDSFASKDLTYTRGAMIPDMVFRQPDFGEVMEVNIAGGEIMIDWTPPSGDQDKSFSLGVPDDLVVDAGFDHFIRANWNALVSGDSVSFRFLGPTRGEHYGFVAEPADADDFDAAREFRIRPSGFVTRFLVDPIYLGYNDDGFLTDFSGLSNIRKNADGNYLAHIRYRQETTPPCPLLP